MEETVIERERSIRPVQWEAKGVRTDSAPMHHSFDCSRALKQTNKSTQGKIDGEAFHTVEDRPNSLELRASGRGRGTNHTDCCEVSRPYIGGDSQVAGTAKINKLLFMVWYLEMFSFKRPSPSKRIFGVK